jgi:gentisate 1,2-dioxygenase
MTGNAPTNLQAARQDYYERLKPAGLAPLWEVLADLVTPTPQTRAVPARWRFSDLRPLLMEAGELITAAEAERRVLILENPGLPGQSRITNTLYAGLQLILPGEVAPAHRHTQSALRFVLDGGGAFTALDGERVMMERYDLILTPNWLWHDHGNETDVPMVWLDGLDIPLVQAFDASFAEKRDDHGVHPTTRPVGDAQQRWGRSMRPARAQRGERRANPMFFYRHAEWRAVLDAMRAADAPHPHDGYRMEFINPVDGGPMMATISAFAQLVPRGMATRPLRSSDGMVLVAVEGSGQIVIDGEARDMIEGDIVVVPSWAQRHVAAEQDLVLFGYSDKAAQESLLLWREQLF